MRTRRRRSSVEEAAELNITAFLNLMVILVPFLLITAVFSRMVVLELNLPALNAKSNKDEKIKLQLQILVTNESLVIQDALLGQLKSIPRNENGAPFADEQRKIWKPLTDTLVEIKTRFPDEQAISLLLARDVNYKSMISLMDRVRSADIVQSGILETVELFPQVSIGDIPEAAASQEQPVSSLQEGQSVPEDLVEEPTQ